MIDVIGSKNRLKILKNLSRQDMYLTQLIQSVKMDSKSAKHHLKTLVEAGLISSYPSGRRRYYRLEKDIFLKISPPPEGKFLLCTSIE